MVDNENELKETEREPDKVKDIWCQVLPNHGSVSKIGNTNVEEAVTRPKIRCRKLSLKTPKEDMFFKNSSTGEKFEILDWISDYKDNNFWEFRCKISYE